jgi:hypothetical protein
MNFLHRYAFDLIPAAIVALILLYLVGSMAKPEESCPPMYRMKVSMEKNGEVLVCKYRP